MPQYNVLLVMTDQHPMAGLGCYGNPHDPTPNLDKLAASGVRFENCYIAGFPCSPSRASILSGRYPHGHGVVKNSVIFEENVPSLGNILSGEGYDMALFGKWHLGGFDISEGGLPALRRVPGKQGYRFEGAQGGGEDEPQHGFQCEWAGGCKQYRQYLEQAGFAEVVADNPDMGGHTVLPSGGDDEHCCSQIPEEHHVEAFIARRAVDFIKSRRGKTTPFGAVVSFFAPHLPVAPPRPWDELYSLDDVRVPANHHDTMRGKAYEIRKGPCYKLDEWSEEQFKDYIRRYWGYCAYVDRQAGRVLDALAESGLADDTLVVFTSDHGDMVGSHGMVWKWDHCGYEELYRTPLLIRIPGVTPGDRVRRALVSNIDILPTILELVGVRIPGEIQGRSLLGLISGCEDTFRDRIFADDGDMALITCDGRWKYVLNWQPRDIDELYDLRIDPGEMKNLANDAGCRETVKRMREHIFAWLEETGHPYSHIIRNAVDERVSVKDYPEALSMNTQ